MPTNEWRITVCLCDNVLYYREVTLMVVCSKVGVQTAIKPDHTLRDTR